MLTSNNRIKQANSTHIYDFDSVCPAGKQEFHAFVWFTDRSHTLWSKIFATNRAEALQMTTARFADCANYISSISVDTSD